MFKRQNYQTKNSFKTTELQCHCLCYLTSMQAQMSSKYLPTNTKVRKTKETVSMYLHTITFDYRSSNVEYTKHVFKIICHFYCVNKQAIIVSVPST